VLIGVLAGYWLGNFPVRNGAEQFVDYHLGSLDDFPTGSVGEFYVSLGQNN